MISQANLDFWIKNNYNVLFRGKHGVGKTSIILQSFQDHGLKYQYFSASTMDPWVDFIGVPKEKIDEKGNSYLDLVRPKNFQDDDVEALFFDEFNRSPKKVRNAVMELIQFKSINGRKFNNLKFVWAAINPDDDEQNKYDVETLDPAQFDRFHAIVDVPYIPYAPFFRKKYGLEVADVGITWWKELTAQQKDSVSPRRLDYALDMHTKGGDVKFVLPNSVNVSKLLLELSTGSISKKVKEYYDSKEIEKSKEFFAVENNYNAGINVVVKNKEYQEFFLPLISEEKLASLISKEKNIQNYVFNNFDTFEKVINNIAQANSGSVSFRAKKEILKHNPKVKLIKPGTSAIANIAAVNFTNNGFTFCHSVKNNSNYISDYNKIIGKYPTFHVLKKRLEIYDFMANNLPGVLNDDISNSSFDSLYQIFWSSQHKTIDEKMPNLIGMLNHVCSYRDSKGNLPNKKFDIWKVSYLKKRLGKECVLSTY